MRRFLRVALAAVVAVGMVPIQAEAEGTQLSHCFWTASGCGCASWGSCAGVSCPGTGMCITPQ
jgi:hypothetical protein